MKYMVVEEGAILAVSRDELNLLAGSIRETLEVIEEWEFSTLLGVEISEALRLQVELMAAIDALPRQD